MPGESNAETSIRIESRKWVQQRDAAGYKPTPYFGDPDFNLTDNDRGNPKPEWKNSQWKETKSSAWQQDGRNNEHESYQTYHHEERYEYKRNANWYTTSSSSVTNEKCKGKPNAPIPPWRKRGDIRLEKHTWCTANNWQQAQAGADPATAANAAEATAAADAAEATAAAKATAAAAVAAAAAATAVASAAVEAASAATTAVAKAKHKEEKYWKSYNRNEKKPYKTAEDSRFGHKTWLASTSLDKAIEEEEEEEEEIDPEHLSRGHCM